ncbi:hypothetical protein JCM10908_002008 [Rhodotorula pacifica]|uniref:Taf10p n=1 Tax=Rhodotorula pacifica TaxID=1495444 RepID=UPI0031740EC5
MNPNDLFLRAHAQSTTATDSTPQPAANGSTTTTTNADLVNPTPEQLQLLFQLDQQHQRQQRQQREHDSNDGQLAQLLDAIDDYKPIIPDEVTDYYLQRAGFDTNDVRVKRLLGLAAQRFISSIAADAFQYARARTAAGPGGRVNAPAGAAGAGAGAAGQAGTATAGAGAGASAAAAGTAPGTAKAKQGRQRTVLTMEDLSAALKEYGVDASRAPYYL